MNPVLQSGIIFGLLITLLAHLQSTKRINSFAGPYIAVADNFFVCDEVSSWKWNVKATHWNPVRPNEPQRVTGYINGTGSPSNLTDQYFVHVFIDKRSNNMWKENYFVIKYQKGGCTELKKNIPSVFETFMSRHIKNNTICNVPAALYEVKDEPIRWTFPNLPILPYGNYRLRYYMGNAREPLTACLGAIGRFVPKV